MKFSRLRRGLATAACGLVIMAASVARADSASPGQSKPEQPDLFTTYLVFESIASDDYSSVNRSANLLSWLSLDESTKEGLLEITKRAFAEDVAFQRTRLAAMCSKKGAIETSERLADEYVSYTGDVEANQIHLAGEVLEQISESTRATIFTWINDSFRIHGTTRADERRAIMGSSSSAPELLNKFCADLGPQ